MNMKANEIGQMQVGYFSNFYDRVPKHTTLDNCLTCIPQYLKDNFEHLRQIKDESEQKKEKLNFPMFTPGAICGYDENGIGTRKHEYVLSKNNLLVLDIDKKDNPTITMDYLKTALFKLPYIYAVSKSIRGNGLFVIVLIEDINQLVSHFKAIEKEYAECGIVIDAACKDLTRARFISYDPDILIKRNTEIIPYTKKYIEPVHIPAFKLPTKSSNSLSDDDVFVYNCIEKLIDYGYSVSDYNSWWIDACRLSTLGSMGEDLFVHLSRQSAGYKSDSDAIKKFHNALKTSSKFDRESSMCYYFGIAKKKFGNGWINKIKENKI